MPMGDQFAEGSPRPDILWALEATTDNVILVDRDFRITYINSATARLNNITQQSVIGKSLWDTWPGNLNTDIERNYRKAMAENVPIRFLHSYVDPGRFDLWLEIHAFPSPDGLAIFFREVSDLHREAVREAYLTATINSTAGGFYSVDRAGLATVCNSAFLQMLGFSDQSEVVGRSLHDLIHHTKSTGEPYLVEECPIYQTARGERAATHVVGELFFRQDGTSFPVEYWTSPILINGKVEGAVTTFIDVTERLAAEVAARENEARYKTLFDTVGEGFCVVQMIFDEENRPLDYRFRQFNPAFTELTGIPAEHALAGRTAREAYPSLEEYWFEIYGKVALTGESVRFENLAEAMNKWFSVHAFRIGSEGSHDVGILFQDITQRYLNEHIRTEAQDLQDQILEMAQVATFDWDIVNDVVYGNPLFDMFFGMFTEDRRLDVRPYLDAIHEEDRALTEARINHSVSEDEPYEIQYRVTGTDGQERWLLTRGYPRVSPDGQPLRLSGVVLDVTTQAVQSVELELERSRLEAVFEDAPAAIAVMRGMELRFEVTNHMFRNLFTAGETIVGKTLAEALPDAVEQGYDVFLRGVIESGIPQKFADAKFEIRARGDEPARTYYLDFVYQPLREPDGTITGIFAHVVDTTDQVLARQELAQVEEDRRLALDSAKIGSWNLDLSDRSLTTDPRFREILGVEESELSFDTGASLIHPDDRDRVVDLAMAAIREYDPKPLDTDFRVIHKDASVHWVAARGGVNIQSDGSRSFDGTILDVTAQRSAEAALRASEERFRAFQETTPDPFTIIEAVRDHSGDIADFRWIYVNDATSRLTGETPEELIGSLVSARRPGIKETDLYRKWLHCVETGESVSVELAITFPKGRSFLRLTGVRIGDGIATAFTDLTQRQLTEQHLQEVVAARTEQLQAAVKEAEGFNYSIAHDLRAPLRAMMATSSILVEEASATLSQEHQKLLMRQKENASRLGRLIDELLRLSRLARAEVHRSELNMSELVRSVFAETIVKNGCHLVAQPDMKAMGDAGLVRTVLQNLIGNACKFSPHGGTIRAGLQDGVFSISDEGVGFSMEFATKIFLPFERLVTETEFEGTGIGLANVERIIKRHGGKVWVESEVGKGTTFYFRLS